MKIGIDIIEITRIEKIKDLSAFLDKNFSSIEIEYIMQKNYAPQTIAGMFCAKEAVLKAFEKGLFEIPLQQIVVCHKPNSAPYIEQNATINELLNSLNLTEINISISHSIQFATAICHLQ